MGRYAIIPTRYTLEQREDSATQVGALNEYLKTAGWEVCFVQDATSMLGAFKTGIEECNLADDDYVIFCHDDIEHLLRPEIFNKLLDAKLKLKDTGFVGIAGCSNFGDYWSFPGGPCKGEKTANWFENLCGWRGGLQVMQQKYDAKSSDCAPWRRGGGLVLHGNSIEESKFDAYGIRSRVVVLDGVFLATTGRVVKSISFNKPSVLKSNWHMYDALLTFQAHRKGFKNYVVPILLRHASGGDYQSEYYYEDSITFMKLFERDLPAIVVD